MMTKEQAIEVLIGVAHGAQKSGVLTLQNAPIVAQAVAILTHKPEPKKEEVVEETAEQVKE